jgi:hypothetical protein
MKHLARNSPNARVVRSRSEKVFSRETIPYRVPFTGRFQRRAGFGHVHAARAATAIGGESSDGSGSIDPGERVLPTLFHVTCDVRQGKAEVPPITRFKSECWIRRVSINPSGGTCASRGYCSGPH